MRAVVSYLRLGRPLFLVGGVLFHALGVTIALTQGVGLRLSALVWGQVAITAVQLMTHYSNDYFDLAADRANPTPTRWSGGSRMLPEGHTRPGIALATALVCAAIALLAAVVLAFVMQAGPLTLPLLLLALGLAWFYSAPPLRLHSRGVGELTVALLVPGLTTLVGYYLQAGRLTLLPFLAILPLSGFQFVMLLAIEFPDAAGDAAVGKDTLVVRLGGAGAARLLLWALAGIYVGVAVLVPAGLPLRVVILFTAFSLPGAAWLARRVGQGAWAQPRWWSWLGFVGIALLMGSAAMELVGFLSLWLAR